MRITETKIPAVKLIEPKVFGDELGFFMETWNEKAFHEASINATFVQKSYRGSVKNILRTNSPTFGQWVGEYLSEENNRIQWVPPGFAHGFLVTSDTEDFQYKCADLYAPQYEQSIHWAGHKLAIAWPDVDEPLVSEMDRRSVTFEQTEYF